MQTNQRSKDNSHLKIRTSKPLIHSCNNWKSQNQILIFGMVLFLTILLIVYLLSYYFLTLTIQELQKSSDLIFQQEKNNQIDRYSKLQQRFTKQYFQSGTSELERLNQIFHLTQKGIIVIQPSDCIFNYNEKDPYQRNCQFCYGFCNYTNETNLNEYEIMLNFTSMLTEIAAILDLTRQTYFTGIAEDQYFSTYESPVKKGFQSHKRQWYLDHMAQMSSGKQMIVSAPYFSQLDTINIAQTFNLTNLENQFIGVIAKAGNFSTMPNFQTSQIVPTLVNYKGDLVISELYLSTKNVTKFYQTNLTGYTKEDWNTLIDLDLQQEKTLTITLYNSLFEQELLFSVIDMQNPPFFLLLYINDTEYNQYEEVLFAKFYKFQYNFLILSLQISLGIIIFILTVQFISISLISKDLRKLTSMTCQSIKSRGSRSKQNFTEINNFANTTIKNLFQAYHSLIRNITTSNNRNVDCQYLEHIKYPFQYRQMDKQLFKYYLLMKKQFCQITNTTAHINNQNIDKVQSMICSSMNEVYKKKKH